MIPPDRAELFAPQKKKQFFENFKYRLFSFLLRSIFPHPVLLGGLKQLFEGKFIGSIL